MEVENMFDYSRESGFVINKSHMVSKFTLMCEDNELIDIDTDLGTLDVNEYNYNLLPLYLKSRNTVKYQNFADWASSRILLLDRVNAKKILNICQLNQMDKFEIAKACRLLSVDDCFWIREDKSEKWADFNLRNNSLSKALSTIALSGQYVTLRGDITTPELTCLGSYPKCWIRENNHLVLCKKSLNDFESEKEVLVSDILDLLQISHINYRMDTYENESVCKCDCMVNEKVSRVNFGDVRYYFQYQNLSVFEWLEANYKKEFYEMLLVDYLVANTDRHPGNWGFYLDNETGLILGLHPLYDHNNAFDSMVTEEYGSQIIMGYTMKDAAIEAQKFLNIDLDVLSDIPCSRFEELNIDYDQWQHRIQLLKEREYESI